MAQNAAFVWDKQKYTTHVDAMDKEHEIIINVMNKLFQENEAGSPKAQLLATIQKLEQVTREHFSHEEKMFSGLKDYSSAAVHKKIHENLLNDFATHAKNFKNANSQKVPDDFFRFLKVWLSAHICGIDRKYGEIVKAG